MRIVLLTRDSLYSHLVVEHLIRTLKDEIVLICLSAGYGTKRYRLLPAIFRTLRHSGLRFLTFLALYLLVYRFFLLVGYLAHRFLGIGRKRLLLSELVKPYGIRIWKVYDINAPNSVELLKATEPDLILSIYFDQWVGPEVLKIPCFGCINLHHALLPEFAGPFPNFWALLKKRDLVGVTIHYMNEDLDAGDIIAQRVIRVTPSDTVMSLDLQAHLIGSQLLIDAVEKIRSGRIVATPQDRSRRTYFSHPSKRDISELKAAGRKLLKFGEYLYWVW